MSFLFLQVLRQERPTNSRLRTAFLLSASILVALSSTAQADELIGGEKMKKAPYKVLFSNDTTNILTCVSPYHKKREPFKEEMLEGTVDETAGIGIDVHMLQPGLGWVPWWQSTVYSAEEHARWYKEKTGSDVGSFDKYVLDGGDMVQVFVDRCHERGLTAFISQRLNDGHHVRGVGSRFYEEHPEYRIGPDRNNWYQGVHNWAIPEVREHKFAFIQEICENYDIDGFELDFMRHVSYFQVDKTTSEQRARIITEFVAQMREVLDRTAKPGQRRWLCVRVPAQLTTHDPLGIDLPAMVEAGVDMINLSFHYFTEQQSDMAQIREMVPDAAIYLEMTHCTAIGVSLTKKGGDNFTFRRATDEQFYTAAHLAYARGADGVSAFNFVYYREHGTPGRGPFEEPPFHVFNHLGDPEWVAKQPQHYILGNVWNQPPVPNRQIPRKMTAGKTAKFTLDMAPPEGGWETDGKLRIQGGALLGDSQWTAQFNGADLNANSDVAEPYPNPYPPLLGEPKQLRAWTVPGGLLRDGINEIEIAMSEGEPVNIVFLDLGVK